MCIRIYIYIYISCINFDLVFPSLRFFSPQKHRIEIQIKHWQRENENAKISKIRRKISMEKFYALVEKKKRKKEKECKFSKRFEIPNSEISDFEFIDRISARASDLFQRRTTKNSSLRISEKLFFWQVFEWMTLCGDGFYSSRKIKETKREEGKGKNWHPLCTHPNLPSGKLILNSKVRAVGLPPLMRSIPFILR